MFYGFRVGKFPESESRLQAPSDLRKKRASSYRILKIAMVNIEMITASRLYVVVFKW